MPAGAPAREKLHGVASFIIDSYQHDPNLMKVIIVEVTRAANTFGRAHLAEIREAYDGIAAIFAKAQEDGTFRADISPQFATLCFYGAIEQLLTAWIFEEVPRSAEEFDLAKREIVETVCGGAAGRARRRRRRHLTLALLQRPLTANADAGAARDALAPDVRRHDLDPQRLAKPAARLQRAAAEPHQERRRALLAQPGHAQPALASGP